jgi:uncharacterized repeat protein (TIGR01451 family)
MRGISKLAFQGPSRRLRRLAVTAMLAGVVVIFASVPGGQAGSTPGVATSTSASTAVRNGDPLLPFYNASGTLSLSVDANGTNNPAGGEIDVQKNAGATVLKAFLFAASTGFSGYTPQNGDVTLDGNPITWDPANTISNGISSVNAESDVTALVKPKVDAAPAGIIPFIVAEGTKTGLYDGEILAVVLNDPTVTAQGSVILMYGAQQTTGDTFNVGLAEPVNKSNPNFGMNLSLGISFGFQPSGQYSTVDVNGTRMTSSAGGQDDGEPANGALITAGGVGDLNDNPPDPNATDTTCVGFFGPAPRCDDELYNLLPFVNNGDTSLSFRTQNPSNDDNIFFAALDVRGTAAVVGKGIVLAPASATNPVGTPHTVTATVQDTNGNPISGVTVTFRVTSGPNMGLTGTGVTDAQGKATFTYTSALTGTDTIVASFSDATQTYTSNEVTKTWTAAAGGTDVSILKTAPATIPAPGYHILWTLTVTNNGPTSADGVMVTDVLPAGVVSPQATTTKGTCTIVSGTLTCDLGTLASGETETIRVIAQTSTHLASHSTLTNTATVTSTTADTNPANNTSTATTTVG